MLQHSWILIELFVTSKASSSCGSDSPVSAAFSTLNEAVSRRHTSAGTLLPLIRYTTSPTTSWSAPIFFFFLFAAVAQHPALRCSDVVKRRHGRSCFALLKVRHERCHDDHSKQHASQDDVRKLTRICNKKSEKRKREMLRTIKKMKLIKNFFDRLFVKVSLPRLLPGRESLEL